MVLNALSLTQPWADLVVLGKKKIETRSWGTTFRGELAIQAAKRWTGNDRRLVSLFPFNEALGPRAIDSFALGAVVGVVELVAVQLMVEGQPTDDLLGTVAVSAFKEPERSFGGYAPGRYAWKLANPRRLAQPVPCVGRLGIFGVPATVEQAVREQLEASSRTSTTRKEVTVEGPGIVRPEQNDSHRAPMMESAGAGAPRFDEASAPAPRFREELRLELEERAAILEFDGGLSREESDRQARAMWGLPT